MWKKINSKKKEKFNNFSLFCVVFNIKWFRFVFWCELSKHKVSSLLKMTHSDHDDDNIWRLLCIKNRAKEEKKKNEITKKKKFVVVGLCCVIAPSNNFILESKSRFFWKNIKDNQKGIEERNKKGAAYVVYNLFHFNLRLFFYCKTEKNQRFSHEQILPTLLIAKNKSHFLLRLDNFFFSFAILLSL